MHAIYLLVSVALAVGFYRVRGTHPFWYGVGEIAVGSAALSTKFFPPYSYLLVHESSLVSEFVSGAVAVIVGIYLLVRGLDNMDRDLPYSWRPVWVKLFPKR